MLQAGPACILQLQQRLQGQIRREGVLADPALDVTDDEEQETSKQLLQRFDGCNPFLVHSEQLQKEPRYSRVLVGLGVQEVDVDTLCQLALGPDGTQGSEGGSSVIDDGLHLEQSWLCEQYMPVWIVGRVQYDKGLCSASSPVESRMDERTAEKLSLPRSTVDSQRRMSTVSLRLSIVNNNKNHWIVVAGRRVPLRAGCVPWVQRVWASVLCLSWGIQPSLVASKDQGSALWRWIACTRLS